MSNHLFDNEWHFLLQLINRIYVCSTYTEVCGTLAYQLQTLIPYKQNVFFEITRYNGIPLVQEPISFNINNESSDSSRFLSGAYPHWSEYIMSPHSSVFRQSDIVPEDKWERSHVFQDIWKPQGNYYGIFLSIINHDRPLTLMLLTRSKDQTDFSNKEIRILQLLSVTLEQKLSDLKEPANHRQRNTIDAKIAEFSLTRREREIIHLICQNADTDFICEKLVITTSTFHKHLSNIYGKTGFKNRLQLSNYFNGYTL